MSNHPSAFMDPILLGANAGLSIHYMVRGDVFKKWLLPLFNGAQMIQIFRTKEDGAGSREKNIRSFNKVKRLIYEGKAILFFAEGYTDNTFIRSLKSVKKGPVRVAFEAMEECDWSKPLYLQAVGINYSHPSTMRSDVLYCYDELVDLHQFKAEYEKHPARTVTKVTRLMQDRMQNQIAYAENRKIADLTENICCLTRKGMNHENHDRIYSLEERFSYTRSLATTLNKKFEESGSEGELKKLSDELKSYFDQQKRSGVKENWVHDLDKKKRKVVFALLYLIFMFPFALVGFVHGIVPYLFIKRFTERSFKRPVFWSGVKLGVGWLTFGLFNIAAIPVFHIFIYPNIWLALGYYFIVIPICFIIFYVWKTKLKDVIARSKAKKSEIEKFVKWRRTLLDEIHELGLEDQSSVL